MIPRSLFRSYITHISCNITLAYISKKVPKKEILLFWNIFVRAIMIYDFESLPYFFYFLYNNISREKNQDFPKKICILHILHRTFFQESLFFVNLHHAQISHHSARVSAPTTFRPECISLTAVSAQPPHASNHMAPVCPQAPRTRSALRAGSFRPLPPPRCTWRALSCKYCARQAS